jgi:membrane protein DedA with SNARE-associated domain
VVAEVARYGAYAVFALMLTDAIVPAGGELTMLYAGVLAAGAEATLFGAPLATPGSRSAASGTPERPDHARHGRA